MLHINAKNAHGRGDNRGSGHQAEQSEDLDSAKHADEQKQLIQMSAIAQQQWTDDIVGYGGNNAANGRDQDSFTEVAG